jgi:hypothetical protein
LRRSDKTVVAGGGELGCADQVSRPCDTCATESIWLPLIQSRYPLWLATLCFLTALALNGYVLKGDRSADSLRMNLTAEDQEAIVATGSLRQQRDAVLANFARYGNRNGERRKSGAMLAPRTVE